jgi:hypothetical protein
MAAGNRVGLSSIRIEAVSNGFVVEARYLTDTSQDKYENLEEVSSVHIDAWSAHYEVSQLLTAEEARREAAEEAAMLPEVPF